MNYIRGMLHDIHMCVYTVTVVHCICVVLQRACPQGTPSGRLGGQCPVTVLRSTKSTSSRAVTGAARVDGSPGANNPCSQDSWNCVDDVDDFRIFLPYFPRRSHQNRGPWGPLAIQGFIMYSAATGPARSEKPMGHLKQSWNFGGGCEFWTFSCYPKSIYINLSKSDKADTNLKANFYPHEY